ncbi:MAG: XdhC family protein [Eubacteriales bacterium]|nr:XdhC family protein [Eubacteriales bacterium]
METADFQIILQAVKAGQPAAWNVCVDGVTYTRNFLPRERLILLGGGHIAQPLCQFAAALGFAVTVVDDRIAFANRARFPEAEQVICNAFPAAIACLQVQPGDYIAVITRGHKHDALCLRTLLQGTMPRYLGMIGSRRRTTGLLHLLEQESFDRARLDAIETPIGLDIGALTKEEIAISIAAQLVQYRRKDTDRRSKHSILLNEDIDFSVLELLADDSAKKAVLLVCETDGSTPVKSGAMMAIDENFRPFGSIGGGCGESAAMLEAFDLMGSGRSKCITVDMNNDVAEEEGMVCGGRMKVFLADL